MAAVPDAFSQHCQGKVWDKVWLCGSPSLLPRTEEATEKPVCLPDCMCTCHPTVPVVACQPCAPAQHFTSACGSAPESWVCSWCMLLSCLSPSLDALPLMAHLLFDQDSKKLHNAATAGKSHSCEPYFFQKVNNGIGEGQQQYGLLEPWGSGVVLGRAWPCLVAWFHTHCHRVCTPAVPT